MKEKDLNSIIVEDQELEVIIQPNDVLTTNMELLLGGSGQPGQPGGQGVPGDCPCKCGTNTRKISNSNGGSCSCGDNNARVTNC